MNLNSAPHVSLRFSLLEVFTPSTPAAAYSQQAPWQSQLIVGGGFLAAFMLRIPEIMKMQTC